jgi:hypothetical protein
LVVFALVATATLAPDRDGETRRQTLLQARAARHKLTAVWERIFIAGGAVRQIDREPA